VSYPVNARTIKVRKRNHGTTIVRLVGEDTPEADECLVLSSGLRLCEMGALPEPTV
jgi:hypothetical protein